MREWEGEQKREMGFMPSYQLNSFMMNDISQPNGHPFVN